MSMKSTFFSAFLLLLSVVCRAESVSLDGAVAIANKFLSANAATWQVDVKRNPHQLRARSKNEGNSLYYMFKGNDNCGFVIVSGDDVARPVLGYSFDTVIPDSETLPPGMQDWLDDMELQIRSAIESGYEPTEAQRQEYDVMAAGDNDVLLETAKWGQEEPFNYKCPLMEGEHCLVGCGPVAYAILMKYYGYPTKGRGKTPAYTTPTNGLHVPSRNIAHVFNWNNMLLDYENGYTEQQKLQVANLMADVGAMMQADYGIDGTDSAVGEEAVYTYFDYYPGRLAFKDFYTAASWREMLHAELEQNHPVLYRADNDGENAHIFLLDGCTYNNYYSVNWGWYGYFNGFYTLDALDAGNLSFPTGQVACLGCVPMPMCPNPDVAEVNGETYPTLSLAVAAAPAGGESSTIRLLADASSDYISIDQGKDIVLDLNGKELSMSDAIEVYGSLSVLGENGGKITKSEWDNGIFNNFGNLTINGGTFTNQGEGGYSRCVWSSAGSSTTIQAGTFSAYSSVLCFNGDATIMDGVYTCFDNNSVIYNYNTSGELRICGGTFVNDAPDPSESKSDYRRAIWSIAESNTIIEDGSFESSYQVLCFNGDATVYNAKIYNRDIKRYGLLAFSEALVSVKNCKLKAYHPFYATDPARIECEGGIYSEWVEEEFVKEGYVCTSNTDNDTRAEYPYIILDEGAVGIANNRAEEPECGLPYSIAGRPVNDNYQGIVIQSGRKQLRKR